MALSGKLTKRLVENLGPGRHGDGSGLYLVVDPSGARRWIARVVVKDLFEPLKPFSKQHFQGAVKQPEIQANRADKRRTRTMRKHVEENERAKRAYVFHLEQAAGLDEKTTDKVLAAILKFEQ
ncbi:hypothetical protein PEL8287_00210 [Roseovarius litorisediminis]|uniref:Integrase DNA-binding domain-containing protein n=1 Tax=Roseovarius litorisediminis TaxID=1312363 RepID=A0A1Y5RBF9_9RHOB|nr:Arm DNA-binding domain-containing protein [Roseovarius litorisediminis]SLN10997.1 hypothetical protein PEL8287_00210 [Roseovarius litorisediminis]